MAHDFKGGYGKCLVCDKILYSSRKEAKRSARYKHPGAKGLNAYYCPYSNGWHYGNLPPGGREQARRIMRFKTKGGEN